ncbi:MAG: autotransporter domain-containing protein [Candidatus Omnitrophica bacterium]|nr:autotransporter domain-containing protein [Candidatus Omnitrophota bacterium]
MIRLHQNIPVFLKSLFFTLVLSLFLFTAQATSAYTITNNNDNDDTTPGSLRTAITNHNTDIEFNNIGSITLLSNLPNILGGDTTFDVLGAYNVTILNFGVFNNDSIQFENLGESGTFTISNSHWQTNSILYVAMTQSGTLNISNGSLMESSDGYVGASAGSIGSVTVDSASQWNLTGNLYVGGTGTGTLQISGGGVVNCYDAIIGNDLTAVGNVTVSGSGSKLKAADGLEVASTGTGTLTISNGGTVTVNNGAGTVLLAGDDPAAVGTLNIGAGASAGTLEALTVSGGDGTAVVNFDHNETAYNFSPTLSDNLSVNLNGTGATILSGSNNYTGPTTVNDGTLRLNSASISASAVTVKSGAKLAGKGTLGGALDMKSGSSFDVTLKNTTTYDQIRLTHNGNVFESNVTVNVTLDAGASISNGNQFLIIRSDGTITTATPTIVFGDSSWTFSPSWGTLDTLYGLILTAQAPHTATYVSQTTTQDAQGPAAALDNAKSAGASGDMQTVLNTLDNLSGDQLTSALDAMLPDISGSNPQVSVQLLDQFVGAQMNHLGGVSELALADDTTPQTGVSAGEAPSPYSTWFKGFGSYAHQDPRGTSQGYNFSNVGGALGVDMKASDTVTTGLAFGNSESWVRSKDSAARTLINASQVSWYSGFKPISNPWYFNTAFTYAYNQYVGSREIHISPTDNRVANAHYRGGLYGAALETGYAIKLGKVIFTPLTALSYSRLHVAKYAEAGADALDLNVNEQNYDNLRTALGGKLEVKREFSWGSLLPEIHARYSYDIIADRQNMVASFAGGGTAFTTQGYKPAKSGASVGTAVTLATKRNITISLEYDLELREDYYAHTGFLNVTFKF